MISWSATWCGGSRLGPGGRVVCVVPNTSYRQFEQVFVCRAGGGPWLAVPHDRPRPHAGCGVNDATTRYLQTLDGLTSAQLAEASLLPGWTRAHVVAHLAQHAEAPPGRSQGLRRGERLPVYEWPGAAQRRHRRDRRPEEPASSASSRSPRATGGRRRSGR